MLARLCSEFPRIDAAQAWNSKDFRNKVQSDTVAVHVALRLGLRFFFDGAKRSLAGFPSAAAAKVVTALFQIFVLMIHEFRTTPTFAARSTRPLRVKPLLWV